MLRKLTSRDAGEIFFLQSNEDVLRYLGKEPMQDRSEAEAFFEKINTAIDANESILRGIARQEDPSVIIATICIWNIKWEHLRGEIGFILHPGYWGRGIMKEAINAVVHFAFDNLNLHSLEALISGGNRPSASVLEKTGFVKEGHLRESFFFRGDFSDTIIYSKLKQLKARL